MLVAENDIFAAAIAVAVAPDIHPMPRPAFAVGRTGQQAVDRPLISVIGLIGAKRVQLGPRWWQPDQIERHAAEPQVFRNRQGRCEPL